jgi:hypothetical protein
MTRRHTAGRVSTYTAARVAAGLAAGLTLLVAAPAGAQMEMTTLTFESVPGSPPAGGVRRVNNCVVENGFQVTVFEEPPAGGMLQAVPCGTGTPTPSTPTALAMYTPDNASFRGNAIFNDVGSAIEFTPVMGGTFSLFSLDLAPVTMVPPGTGSMPVTFTGVQLGGMSVMQGGFFLPLNAQAFMTFTLNNTFANLTSARVTFGAPDYAAQVDNVRLGTAAVIPEPSTYALMATGLVGLATIARRRRAHAPA